MTAKRALRAAATVILALLVLLAILAACGRPQPAPTPAPTPSHQPTASAPAAPVVATPAPTAAPKAPAPVVAVDPHARWQAIRRCIVFHESRGQATVVNRAGVPSYGLYQFIDTTWDRYGGYVHASQAPVAVQTARFWQVWNDGKGRSNWLADRSCWS